MTDKYVDIDKACRNKSDLNFGVFYDVFAGAAVKQYDPNEDLRPSTRYTILDGLTWVLGAALGARR